MQKDNDPKYTCKSTKQKMAEKEKNLNAASPDLSLVEML